MKFIEVLRSGKVFNLELTGFRNSGDNIEKNTRRPSMTVLFVRETSGQYTRTLSNNGRVAAKGTAEQSTTWFGRGWEVSSVYSMSVLRCYTLYMYKLYHEMISVFVLESA